MERTPAARSPRRPKVPARDAEAEGAPGAGCGHAPFGAPEAGPGARVLADAAAMFKALADPERLQLIVRLARGEACVSELAEAGKLTTVSARLQALHAVRLVTRRRDARHVYYALADAHVLELVGNAIEHAGESRAAPAPHVDPAQRPRAKGPPR